MLVLRKKGHKTHTEIVTLVAEKGITVLFLFFFLPAFAEGGGRRREDNVGEIYSLIRTKRKGIWAAM